ncbi:MAG: D-alanyl-D-alanine carboxypeptidase/D-alanyl-D-alanine-endopeptidase [Williamsia sp.]|nr:D-alanyl-D-alanine carboxypeptidase/D-alanyl-D-alanine-endopeptidase [Williamsia sp.]
MTLFKKLLFCWLVLSVVPGSLIAQTLFTQLNNAVKNLEADPQLKHALVGFSVLETRTGKPLYEHNAQIGLAAASSQKVLTSGAAFELLGKDYRYKTELGYEGKIDNGVLKGSLFVTGSGDPTLGSWRWTATNESTVLHTWTDKIKEAGIYSIEGVLLGDDRKWESATIPDGWIWQDMGNYYGAGASSINWRENQYDLILKAGDKIGDTCTIVSTTPRLFQAQLICEVTAAEKGSGDNAYIYLPPYASYGFVRGTIPVGANAFAISGSFPNSSTQLIFTLGENLKQAGVNIGILFGSFYIPLVEKRNAVLQTHTFYTHFSPPLDSINYWFLKKSINLYGEALIKTIAYEKTGKGSTQKGVELVRDFWSRQGIDKSAINILDGSGLSPQNRITADALASAMQYASSRPWFSLFYNALPEINGLKMKSGSIGGARSFTGYSKSRNGNEYTFAIIVNNYDGSAGEMVRKMWTVLNTLK